MPMKQTRCIIFACFFLLVALPVRLDAKAIQSKKFTIVVDPGHGGNDPGAVYHGLSEKNIVLSLALKLGKLINQEVPDANLVYTRQTDSFIPLHLRAQKAIDNKADLFLSLHANSCPSPSIKGTETYVLGMHRTNDNLEVAKKENSVILIENDYNTRYEGFDPNSSESYIMFDLVQQLYLEQSLKMASLVQDKFSSHAARTDRGVKQAGFLVLRQTTMPAVLIEIGYLSNRDEANYLNSETGQNKLAQAICQAVKDYKHDHETRNDLTISQSDNADTEQIESSIQPKRAPIGTSRTESISTENTPKSQTSAPNNNSDKELVKTSSPDSESNICFKIQVAATRQLLELKPYNFKGLKGIDCQKQGNIYKYYYGKTTNYDEANRLKQYAKSVYPDAFIVAFDHDKLIPVDQALGRMGQ